MNKKIAAEKKFLLRLAKRTRVVHPNTKSPRFGWGASKIPLDFDLDQSMYDLKMSFQASTSHYIPLGTNTAPRWRSPKSSQAVWSIQSAGQDYIVVIYCPGCPSKMAYPLDNVKSKVPAHNNYAVFGDTLPCSGSDASLAAKPKSIDCPVCHRMMPPGLSYQEGSFKVLKHSRVIYGGSVETCPGSGETITISGKSW